MVVIKRKHLCIAATCVLLILALFFAVPAGYHISTSGTSHYVTGKTVVIDPGHGGEDPGASSPGGLKEKDINLKIALKVKQLFENASNTCILTRDEDKLHYTEGTQGINAKRRQDLEYRRTLAENSNADLFVSIHLNSFQQSQYYGAQTFFPKDSEESKKLAILIQEEFRERVDRTNKREPLVKSGIRIFRDRKVPTVLAECGFLSNPKDAANLEKDEYLQKVAEAIFMGCMRYFNSNSE